MESLLAVPWLFEIAKSGSSCLLRFAEEAGKLLACVNSAACVDMVQVALRFKPASLSPCLLKLTCIFNNTSANSTTILLSGTASQPQLSWDITDGKLFFRPTCVGATSQRVVTVTNVSRVPVGWQWVLSKKLQEAVTMEPMVSDCDSR